MGKIASLGVGVKFSPDSWSYCKSFKDLFMEEEAKNQICFFLEPSRDPLFLWTKQLVTDFCPVFTSRLFTTKDLLAF